MTWDEIADRAADERDAYSARDLRITVAYADALRAGLFRGLPALGTLARYASHGFVTLDARDRNGVAWPVFQSRVDGCDDWDDEALVTYIVAYLQQQTRLSRV